MINKFDFFNNFPVFGFRENNLVFPAVYEPPHVQIIQYRLVVDVGDKYPLEGPMMKFISRLAVARHFHL